MTSLVEGVVFKKGDRFLSGLQAKSCSKGGSPAIKYCQLK